MHQHQDSAFSDFYYHSPLSVPSHSYSYPYSYSHYSPTTHAVHGQNLWAQMTNNNNNNRNDKNVPIKHKHNTCNVSTTDSFMSRLKRFRFWSPNWWKSTFESNASPYRSNERFEDDRVGQYDTFQQYPTTTNNTHVCFQIHIRELERTENTSQLNERKTPNVFVMFFFLCW